MYFALLPISWVNNSTTSCFIIPNHTTYSTVTGSRDFSNSISNFSISRLRCDKPQKLLVLQFVFSTDSDLEVCNSNVTIRLFRQFAKRSQLSRFICFSHRFLTPTQLLSYLVYRGLCLMWSTLRGR